MSKPIKKYKQSLQERDEELKNKFKDTEFEKGDGFAMFVAAMVTFVPIILVFLGIIYFIVWLIFLR